MADRGIFRVAKQPPDFQVARPLLELLRALLPGKPAPKATGFGLEIQSFDLHDENRATAMYAGEFHFGERAPSKAGPLLFGQKNANSDWPTSFNQLSWLSDFASSERKLHSYFALNLLQRWGKSKNIRKDNFVLCKAVIALATHGQILVRKVDSNSQVYYLRLISKISSTLGKMHAGDPSEQYLKSVAQLYLCTAYSGLDHLFKPAGQMLAESIEKLIAVDGGAVSRKSQDLTDMLALLLPLQAAMRSSHHVFPVTVASTISRMSHALTLLKFEDGGLTTLFGHQTPDHRLAMIFSHAKVETQSTQIAAASGIARVVCGNTQLIADTQTNFGFEFVSGTARLFTSTTARTTEKTQAQIHESLQGTALQVTGSYKRQRITFLSSNGFDLRVEDQFDSPIEIAFQLAPSVRLTATREGNIILLTPDQQVWTFSVRGGEASVEQNSTILRIVSTAQKQMNWAFKKQLKGHKISTRKKIDEPDLLS